MDIMECGSWGFPQLGVHSGGPPHSKDFSNAGFFIGV